MRIMLDTNILLSVSLFPNNRINDILDFIVRYHTLILSDLVIKEFLEVAAYDKFRKEKEAQRFLEKISFTLYKTPKIVRLKNVSIRDENDYDILYSAIKSKVDIFITRDKDFLECGVSCPQMMTLNMFEDSYMRTSE